MKTPTQNPLSTPKQWAMFTLQYLSLRAALLAHVDGSEPSLDYDTQCPEHGCARYRCDASHEVVS
jgi:hypothetical protein